MFGDIAWKRCRINSSRDTSPRFSELWGNNVLKICIGEPTAGDQFSGLKVNGCDKHWTGINAGMELAAFAAGINFGRQVAK